MKLATRGSVRSGYIKQKPTASTKLRASSTVWTALPSIRQFAVRCCSSSCSVILEFGSPGPVRFGSSALQPVYLSPVMQLRSAFLSAARRDPYNNNAQWREVEGSQGYINVPCCLREFSRHVSIAEGMARLRTI